MKTAVVTVENDSCCESPIEDDSWKLHSFCSRHSNFKHPTTVGLGELDKSGQPTIHDVGLRRKLNVGTAFILSYYEHGEGCWSLAGEGMQCRFDTARIAGLLVWEGKPGDCGWGLSGPDGQRSFETTLEARAKNARATLEVYNEWCNGHCYWYSLHEYDKTTEAKGEYIESSGGFIGEEHLLAGLRDVIRGRDIEIVVAEGECAFLVEDALPMIAAVNAGKAELVK